MYVVTCTLGCFFPLQKIQYVLYVCYLVLVVRVVENNNNSLKYAPVSCCLFRCLPLYVCGCSRPLRCLVVCIVCLPDVLVRALRCLSMFLRCLTVCLRCLTYYVSLYVISAVFSAVSSVLCCVLCSL